MKTDFYTCDVFTDQRFGGNPLAVIPDARGLTTEQMQQIAQEFHYSESTFVLPPEQGQTRRVRIFTPASEIAFAGHPNVGTAAVLASMGELGPLPEEGTIEVVFEEDAGWVPIAITTAPGRALRCELKAPKPLELGEPLETEVLAAALRLDESNIRVEAHAPQPASVGLEFILVELVDRRALEAVQIDLEALGSIDLDRPSVLAYCRPPSGTDRFDVRCRMFAPFHGVPEDPATGSANCALAGMLAQTAPEPSGEFRWRVAQGVEMGRPSELFSRAAKSAGRVTDIWVGGAAVLVTRGSFV